MKTLFFNRFTAFCLLLGLFFIGQSVLPTQVYSQNRISVAAYYQCTRDQIVMAAFDQMQDTEGLSSLEIILKKPIRVIVRDLSTLDPRIKNYDALSYMAANGQVIIYINQKHANAPAEALAALLSHEALHNDAQNSIEEEIAGWAEEARVWHELKLKHPSLVDIPKNTYPLVDRLNTLEKHMQNNSLAAFVRSQPGYQGLAEHSPGY